MEGPFLLMALEKFVWMMVKVMLMVSAGKVLWEAALAVDVD